MCIVYARDLAASDLLAAFLPERGRLAAAPGVAFAFVPVLVVFVAPVVFVVVVVVVVVVAASASACAATAAAIAAARCRILSSIDVPNGAIISPTSNIFVLGLNFACLSLSWDLDLDLDLDFSIEVVAVVTVVVAEEASGPVAAEEAGRFALLLIRRTTSPSAAPAAVTS